MPELAGGFDLGHDRGRIDFEAVFGSVSGRSWSAEGRHPRVDGNPRRYGFRPPGGDCLERPRRA